MFHLPNGKTFLLLLLLFYFILMTLAAGKIVRQMLSSWKAIWQFLLLVDLIMPTHFNPLSFKIVHTL